MSEFKGTPGHHQVMYSHDVCIGIGVKKDINFYQLTCNTILPDTDAEYENQKSEIIANMQLYAAAPDLLNALQLALSTPGNEWDVTKLKICKNAISKALGENKS